MRLGESIGSEIKYGLWENGRRVRWFSNEEVELIQKGDQGYRENLKDPQSLGIIDEKSTFDPPSHFKFKSFMI